MEIAQISVASFIFLISTQFAVLDGFSLQCASINAPCMNNGKCIHVADSPTMLGCPSGYLRGGDWCFNVHDSKLHTKDHAQKYCRGQGGELLSLTSPQKRHYIFARLEDMARHRPPEIATNSFTLWTSAGYRYDGANSKWVWWLSSYQLIPVNWTLFERQDVPKPLADGTPSCLYVNTTTNKTTVNVSPCSQSKFFVVCEKMASFNVHNSEVQCDCPFKHYGSHCDRDVTSEVIASTEDQEIHLSCQSHPDIAIFVEYVFYGSADRTFQNVANGDTECFIDTALYYVKLWCHGKVECKFILDDKIPNPCFPLSLKIVDIRWSCRPQKQTTMTSSTMSSTQSTKVSTPIVLSSIETTVENITMSTIETTVENITASTIETTVENVNSSTIETAVENVTASTVADTTIQTSSITDQEPGINCDETEVMGMLWPRRQAGQMITMSCPEGKMGEAIWYCDERGQYVPAGEPDMTQCKSPWTEELVTQMSAYAYDPSEVLKQTSKLLEKEVFTAGDILFAIAVVDKCNQKSLSAYKESTYVQKMQTIEANLNISNGLLGPNGLAQWKGIPTMNRTKNAVQLMDNIEKAIGLFQYVYLNEFFSNSPQIVLDAMELPITQPGMVTARFPSRQSEFVNDVAAELNITRVVNYTNVTGGNQTAHLIKITEKPLKVVANTSRMHRPRIVFILYNNIQSLITDVTKKNTSNSSIISNSPVLTATLVHTGIIGSSYRKQIHYTMRWNKVEWKENRSSCVFWQNRTESGAWSGEGCSLVSTNRTHATCTCDHLTNFAILMDVYGNSEKISPANRLALDIVTYIGCSISVICLTMAIIVFSIFRGLWCPRNTIHRNLCINLCLGQILFMAGIDRTENRVVCGIIAGTLHYCFLSAFAWMCLEGIEIYQMVVRVIRPRETNVLWYYLAGYGIPLMIVIISASTLPHGYGNKGSCWLSTENGLIWAFAGPVAVITLANMAVLCICIKVLYNNGRRMNKHGVAVVKKLGVAVRGALVLLCLLGLTWVFGFVYLGRSTIAFAYIFSILNSAQGLFIFVFQCATNEKVLQHIRRWARRTKLCPQSIRMKLSNGMAPTSSLAQARNSNPCVAARHRSTIDQNIESRRQEIQTVPKIEMNSSKPLDTPLERRDSEFSEKSSELEYDNQRLSVSTISTIGLVSASRDSCPFYISRVGTDDIYVEI